jgi:polar amino acid transport system permease protein
MTPLSPTDLTMTPDPTISEAHAQVRPREHEPALTVRRSRGKTVRLALGLVIIALVAALAVRLVVNSKLDFGVVRQYMFNSSILEGVRRTIVLTLLAMAIGSLLGLLIALARTSSSLALRSLASFYAWIFRGTPVLVQLIIWFNLALVIPRVGISIPGTSIDWSASTNDLITPFVAALLGLALNEAAYLSEIIRAGIISVDRGQTEAAAALGLRSRGIMYRVVMPQAMRAIIPPAGNELITCLKTTSLVSIISYSELLGSAQGIYSVNYYTLELLVVASTWYLVCTTLFSIAQYFVERHFGRGFALDRKARSVAIMSLFNPRRRATS